MSLENAPDEVKLAVDLIMLLENHEIPAETVLKALEIVRRDFEGKVKAGCPHLTLSRRAEESPVIFTESDECCFRKMNDLQRRPGPAVNR